jgi:hypothetical protein
MRALLIFAASLVGVCIAYVVVHLALIEVGQEIVVLHKYKGDAAPSRARLWIVDEGESTWLHHGYADSAWIQRLQSDPVVEIERDGETRRFRAQADPASDPTVHRLLREKYGLADRLVRFWAGTDTQEGFATGSLCTAVPVRLEPL